METVHILEHAGCTIKIVHDEFAENPIADYEDFIKVVAWQRNYSIGNCDDFKDPDAFEDYCKANRVTRLPLYAYVHSGITVNTTGFHCPWDSGQVGWVFVDHAEARSWMQWSRVTAKRRRSLLGQLVDTVTLLDNYLIGNNYGYQVYHNGEEVDACWGFTCEYDGYILDDAKNAAECVPFVQLPLKEVA